METREEEDAPEIWTALWSEYAAALKEEGIRER